MLPIKITIATSTSVNPLSLSNCPLSCQASRSSRPSWLAWTDSHRSPISATRFPPHFPGRVQQELHRALVGGTGELAASRSRPAEGEGRASAAIRWTIPRAKAGAHFISSRILPALCLFVGTLTVPCRQGRALRVKSKAVSSLRCGPHPDLCFQP